MSWDLFISYASEDKEEVARPLAKELARSGLAVWFDEFELKLGDSLLKSIDKGLSRSRYGVVILSHAFFQKYWPQSELAGLVQKERNGKKVILPVWYELSSVDIIEYSPILSDRIAASWSRGLKIVAQQIKEVLAADRFDVRGGPPLRRSSDLSLDERRILFSILVANDDDNPSDDPMHAAEKLFNDWSEPSIELFYLATKETWGNPESASSCTAVLWLLNTGYHCVPWLERLILDENKTFAIQAMDLMFEYLIYNGNLAILQRIIMELQNRGSWTRCLEQMSSAIKRKEIHNLRLLGDPKNLRKRLKKLVEIGSSLSINRVSSSPRGSQEIAQAPSISAPRTSLTPRSSRRKPGVGR